MDNLTIGFIGYGEASYLISKGLKNEGVDDQIAFDINMSDSLLGPEIKKRVSRTNIKTANSLEELCEKSTILLCATSASVAEKIAQEVQQFLKKEHLYIDLNASSPMVQQNISHYISDSKAKFVDAAVMESVTAHGHKVPLFLSGDGANYFEELGTAYGMNLKYIAEEAGASSAIKMFRSIFMKGFTNVLLETLEASEKYNVSNVVLESLDNSIRKGPLDEYANMLINRTSIHAERRVAEMDEVIKTLDSLNVEPTMSKATKQKLQSVVDKRIKEKLNGKQPNSFTEVISMLHG